MIVKYKGFENQELNTSLPVIKDEDQVSCIPETIFSAWTTPMQTEYEAVTKSKAPKNISHLVGYVHPNYVKLEISRIAYLFRSEGNDQKLSANQIITRSLIYNDLRKISLSLNLGKSQVASRLID